KAFLRQPPHRGRGGAPVHPAAGRTRVRLVDGGLYPCQRRLHEHGAAPGAGARARPGRRGEEVNMAARLDYQWHLRQVMAACGMFSTTDLIGPLADRDITLSSSQVYRLVTDRPERLSLKILMALLDILGCTMEDLIEPVAAAQDSTPKAA